MSVNSEKTVLERAQELLEKFVDSSPEGQIEMLSGMLEELDLLSDELTNAMTNFPSGTILKCEDNQLTPEGGTKMEWLTLITTLAPIIARLVASVETLVEGRGKGDQKRAAVIDIATTIAQSHPAMATLTGDRAATVIAQLAEASVSAMNSYNSATPSATTITNAANVPQS